MTEKATAQLEKLKKLEDTEDRVAPTKEALKEVEGFLRGWDLEALPGGAIDATTTAGEWAVRLTFHPSGQVTVLYGAQRLGLTIDEAQGGGA